jgi:integrase
LLVSGLASQVLAILRELQEITGGSRYLFPSVRSWHRPISDNALNAALRRLGYDQTELTIHGMRSTASTLLNENGKWHADAIERQLAHRRQMKSVAPIPMPPSSGRSACG